MSETLDKHKTNICRTFIEARLCFLFSYNLRVTHKPGPRPVPHLPRAQDHSKSCCKIISDPSKMKIQPKSSKKLNNHKVLSFPKIFHIWFILFLSFLHQVWAPGFLIPLAFKDSGAGTLVTGNTYHHKPKSVLSSEFSPSLGSKLGHWLHSYCPSTVSKRLTFWLL